MYTLQFASERRSGQAPNSMATRTVFLVAATLLLTAAPVFGQPANEGAMARIFHHDFRGQPLPADMTPWHVEDDAKLGFEPQGLRITLPVGYIHPFNGLGVKTSVDLRGDFEVTATVEILKVDTPPAGPGAGVGLSVEAADKGEQLRRVVAPLGDHQLLATGHFGGAWTENRAPCKEAFVRLRLTRKGTTLRHSWAPAGDGAAFAVVHQTEFPDDVDHIRLFAINGRRGCLTDVRLLDLEIWSGPKSVSTAVKKWQWLLAGMVIVALSAVAIGGLRFFRRRRGVA
jgi:hypothetical protein